MNARSRLQAEIEEAGDVLHDAVEDAADEALALSRTARREIRSHPAGSVSLALCVGVITGVAISALLRR